MPRGNKAPRAKRVPKGKEAKITGTARKFGKRYPWATWFAMPFFRLIRGRDYDCMTYTMAGMVRNTAVLPQHSVKVSIKIAPDAGSLTVRVLGKRRLKDAED